ncbi:MAG TPA: plastocyanin/azurin family copper-binding protein [Symbiobacteriaceae bacterium]|nr:plastocyanin/azurin family copper-binding protein [Symbiobacteriaceae bacterium]
MNKKIALVTVGLMAAVALAGCGGGSSSGGSTPAGGSDSKAVEVKLKSTQFATKTVEIKAGQTVKWINEDVVDHSVFEGVPDSGKHAFQSADFSTNGSYEHTFDKPGEYNIFCNTAGHHLLGMQMKVVVK